jgi:hypothetical protein
MKKVILIFRHFEIWEFSEDNEKQSLEILREGSEELQKKFCNQLPVICYDYDKMIEGKDE